MSTVELATLLFSIGALLISLAALFRPQPRNAELWDACQTNANLIRDFLARQSDVNKAYGEQIQSVSKIFGLLDERIKLINEQLDLHRRAHDFMSTLHPDEVQRLRVLHALRLKAAEEHTPKPDAEVAVEHV